MIAFWRSQTVSSVAQLEDESKLFVIIVIVTHFLISREMVRREKFKYIQWKGGRNKGRFIVTQKTEWNFSRSFFFKKSFVRKIWKNVNGDGFRWLVYSITEFLWEQSRLLLSILAREPTANWSASCAANRDHWRVRYNFVVNFDVR